MRTQTYQRPEIRDENDNIIQTGTYGKKSAFVNSTNDGILDYINNNLEVLRSMSVGAIVAVDTLPETGETGKYYLLSSDGKIYMYGDKWVEVNTQANGISAYQVAVNNGYSGTEKEWLENEVYGDDIINAETDSDGYLIINTRLGQTYKTALQPIIESRENADESKMSADKAKESENNALAYKNIAVSSASSASISAQNAKTSETNSKASETNASDYASVATTKANEASQSAETATVKASESLTSANNAKASEEKAKESEEKSENSAALSTTKANESSTSADKAKESESNANTSETNAKISEENALTYKNNASDSASLAKRWAIDTEKVGTEDNGYSSYYWAMKSEKSETNAKASEDNAKTSESNANTYMANALTYQNNASSSAAKASVSETNAKASELNAKTSETNASNTADAINDKLVYLENPIQKITADEDKNLRITKLDSTYTTLTINDINGLTESEINTKVNESITTANTYTDTKISNLVGSAPSTLDTLEEIANALGEDANLSATLMEKIGENTTLITNETNVRETVDSSLEKKIAAEITDRTNAINDLSSNLKDEEDSRTLADTNLQSAIDNLKSDVSSTYATKTEVDTKQDKGNYAEYTANANITYGVNTGKTYTYSQSPMVLSNGIVLGGTSSNAGLMTRGICGVTSPATTGACTKSNLYLNYDGDNKYERVAVLGAGNGGDAITTSTSSSTDPTYTYGRTYSAVRGDQMVNYVNAKVGTLSTVAHTGSYTDLTNKPSAYSLPTASSTTLGGIKIGDNLSISNGVLSAIQGTVDLTPYAKTADVSSTYATKSSLATVATSGKYSDLSGTPTALKNPNALTFTGSLSGTYDGSSAKTLVIPVVDSDLSSTSTNALQNKVIYSNLELKAPIESPTFTGTVTIPTLLVTGDVTAGGTITATKVYNAVYNDYAEWFPRKPYGDVICKGHIIASDNDSDGEYYVLATNKSKVVVGICSLGYAQIIGGEPCENGEDYESYNMKKFIPVALAGRVPVWVKGKVKKGDYIIPSSIPGVGVPSKWKWWKSVGKALENNYDKGSKLVMVLVR